MKKTTAGRKCLADKLRETTQEYKNSVSKKAAASATIFALLFQTLIIPGAIFGPQTVKAESCSTGSDTVFLMDISASMQSKLAQEKSDAVAVLAGLQAQDMSTVIGFNTIADSQILTSTHQTTIDRVNSFNSASDLTNLQNGLAVAKNVLDQGRNGDIYNKTIILLTDGLTNRPNGNAPWEDTYNAVDVNAVVQAADSLKSAGYSIFVLAYGTERDETALKTIASDGNHYLHEPTVQQLGNVYSIISEASCGSISGHKYEDANNNGAIEAGEAGLAGWTITLNGPTSGQTTTAVDGSYTFSGLAPGHYTLTESAPSGSKTYTQTLSPSAFDLTKGQIATAKDFANYFPAVDTDGDGITDDLDNCRWIANPAQENNDGDSLGDACDPDIDADNLYNAVDNCPSVYNPDQADADHDGLGDACDAVDNSNDNVGDDTGDDVIDTDNDGIADNLDNCPLIANPNQADTDNDGLGDACDAVDDSNNNVGDDTVATSTDDGSGDDATGEDNSGDDSGNDGNATSTNDGTGDSTGDDDVTPPDNTPVKHHHMHYSDFAPGYGPGFGGIAAQVAGAATEQLTLNEIAGQLDSLKNEINALSGSVATFLNERQTAQAGTLPLSADLSGIFTETPDTVHKAMSDKDARIQPAAFTNSRRDKV